MRHLVTGALVLGALLAACATDSSTNSLNGGSSHARVLLTDSPFPYDDYASVNIYIVSVEASTASDSGAISDPSTWTTVAEPHRAVNVLGLSDGATELLGETDLSAGTYRAVRVTIDVDSSSVIGTGGSPVPVLWQASGRSVLNALVESPLDAPEAGADIVIDFDLGRSFEVMTDSSNAGTRTLLFIPWIRAVNAAATATVTGTVSSSDPVRNRAAVASRRFPNGGDYYYTAASSRVAADGSFRLPWLATGHYQITVEAEDAAGRPYVTDPAVVDLVAGQVVSLPALTLHPDTGGAFPDTVTVNPDSGVVNPDTGTTNPDSGTTNPDSTTSGAPVHAMVRRLDLKPVGR